MDFGGACAISGVTSWKRSFLEAVGAEISCSRKSLRCEHLDPDVSIPLRQLVAGHFSLPLVPRQCKRPGNGKWKSSGVLEMQISRIACFRHKLRFHPSRHGWVNFNMQNVKGELHASGDQHEHFVTEQSAATADVKYFGIPGERGRGSSDQVMALGCSVSTPTSSTPTRQ